MFEKTAPRRRGSRLAAAGLVLVALATTPAAAGNTDRILISGGNEICGDIERLEGGKLRVSTHFMGTVLIDWAQTARIESRLDFEVETGDGRRYSGRLAAAGEDRVLAVSGEHGSGRLPFDEVVRLELRRRLVRERQRLAAQRGRRRRPLRGDDVPARHRDPGRPPLPRLRRRRGGQRPCLPVAGQELLRARHQDVRSGGSR